MVNKVGFESVDQPVVGDAHIKYGLVSVVKKSVLTHHVMLAYKHLSRVVVCVLSKTN